MAVVLVRCRLTGSGLGRFVIAQSTNCLHVHRQLSTLHSVRFQSLLRINRQVYNVHKVSKMANYCGSCMPERYRLTEAAVYIVLCDYSLSSY